MQGETLRFSRHATNYGTTVLLPSEQLLVLPGGPAAELSASELPSAAWGVQGSPVPNDITIDYLLNIVT